MLSTKRDRFFWSKQDRLPEVSFFRLLRENWHPTTRVVVSDEIVLVSRGRHYRYPATSAPGQAVKPSWSPWLWVGS